MSTTNTKRKKGSLPVIIAVTFLAGFLAGAAFTIYRMPTQSPTATPKEQAVSQQQEQAIQHLEDKTTDNPDDFQNWVQLANLYFDTSRYEKAVSAYEHALTLQPGTANILTDLGIMYRRTKRPQKAIETFDRALAMEPEHEIARFNRGIVLFYDLDDKKGALTTWKELVKINPQITTSNGTLLATLIAEIENQQTD